MQIGDLVKFVGQTVGRRNRHTNLWQYGELGLGVIAEIDLLISPTTGNMSEKPYRVLFSGTDYKELNGYHWCDPINLEKIGK